MAATVDVMNTEVLSREGTQLTIQVTVDISGSMLQAEEKILDACNEVGCLATEETLQRFDADGSPIVLGDVNGRRSALTTRLTRHLLVRS